MELEIRSVAQFESDSPERAFRKDSTSVNLLLDGGTGDKLEF